MTAPRVNPFLPNDPVPPALFVGRQREVSTITRALEQTVRGRPESVLLIGPRGSGKTSLVLYAANIAKTFAQRLGGDESRVLPVVIKCGGFTSIDQVASSILNGIFEHGRSAGGKLLGVLTERLASMKVTIGPVSLDLGAIKSDLATSFPRILKRIWTKDLQSEFGALLLLVDEIDDISKVAEFPGFMKNLLEDIRVEPTANIMIVMTVVDEILAILVKSHGSFARIFHVVNLLPLEQEQIEPLVRKCLDETIERTTVDGEFLGLLAVLTAGIPNYIHQFCYNAFEVDSDRQLGRDDLISGASGTLLVRGAFEILWEKHYRARYAEDITSPIKRKILHAMSHLEEPAPNRDIGSLYKKIFQEKPSQNLAMYLTNLERDGALSRHGKSSPYLYEITDPGFKVLLRFHPDTSQDIQKQIRDYMMRKMFESYQRSIVGSDAKAE